MENPKYIVFRGLLREFDDLFDAEKYAAKLAEHNSHDTSKATILVVPQETLDSGLVAVSVGVVIKARQNVPEDETDDEIAWL